jgi:hypothetical protein
LKDKREGKETQTRDARNEVVL